jgi:hypothetical protein
VLDATYVAHQLKTPVESRTGAESLPTLSISRPAVSRLCTLANAATPNTTIRGKMEIKEEGKEEGAEMMHRMSY